MSGVQGTTFFKISQIFFSPHDPTIIRCESPVTLWCSDYDDVAAVMELTYVYL